MGLLSRSKEISKDIEYSENVELEPLSQPVPRKSLRERAMAFLKGFAPGGIESGDSDYVPKKRSFLQRAKELLAKIAGDNETEEHAGDHEDEPGISDDIEAPEPLEDLNAEEENDVLLADFPEFVEQEDDSIVDEEDYIKVKKSEIGSFFDKIAESLGKIELKSDNKESESKEDKPQEKTEEPPPEEDDNFRYQPDEEKSEDIEVDETPEEEFFDERPELPEPRSDEADEPVENQPAPHRIQPQGAIKGFYPPGKTPTLEDYLKDAYGLPSVPLSFRAHEIIPAGSPHSHMRHNLEKAEEFIQAGDLQMATDVYAHTAGRVQNEEIREKIDRNIHDITEYLKDLDNRKREQPPLIVMPGGGASGGSDGAGGAPPLNVPGEGGNASAEKIVQEIAKGFFDIQKASMEAGNITINAPVSMGEGATAGGPTVVAGQARDSDEAEASTENTDDAELAQPGEISEADPSGQTINIPGAGGDGSAGSMAPAPGPDSNESENENEPGDYQSRPLDEQPDSNAGQSSLSGPSGGDNEAPNPPGVLEQPSIPSLDEADSDSGFEPGNDDQDNEEKESGPVQEIRGVLELKPPDEEDTPFLTLTYDFTRIPHEFYLARDHNVFEYAYYKYKPMLVKAQKFIRRKQITRALNYYRVIREQQIPREFRQMIDQNISDITDYLRKYLMARQG